MTYEVLHQDSICTSTETPIEGVGTPVSIYAHSVTCSCGRTGTIAAPGHEDQIRDEWATRNGYTVTKTEGGYEIEYTGGRGEIS